jgi:ferredoxin
MPRVSYLSENKAFELTSQETIYDGFLNHGIDLPHGCLSGSCGACRIEIVKGSQNLSAPSFIEKNTIQSLKEEFHLSSDFSLRLACRACAVTGDIEFKKFEN